VITRRGWAIVATGVALYVASRATGSPNLHMVGFGTLLLPLIAAGFIRWSRQPFTVSRHLAATRGFPGNRVRVDLLIRNEGKRSTSIIFLEDEVPAALGRPARAVVPSIPALNQQTVSYLVSCRRRGRYRLGPVRLWLSDPFGLARVSVDQPGADDLVVYPEVEPLGPWPVAPFGSGTGEAPSHQLFRSGEDFYGMREYVTGDDLRRIHWPSTARGGRLMIRQDEAVRRSSATVLLDTRSAALGTSGSDAFERAVSVAASIAVVFSRGGYSLRLTTPDVPLSPFAEPALLEHLAAVRPSRVAALAPSLTGLKRSAIPDSTLIAVTAPPAGPDVAGIIRAGAVYGLKIAVLVYPHDPASLPPKAQGEMEGRASAARASLVRAGWEVFVLQPSQQLTELWQTRRAKKPLRVGASSS
jgi:uncharacterized protein (DUF58 family)